MGASPWLTLTRRWAGLGLGLVAMLGAATAPSSGCKTGALCDDGFVTAEGDCEALCHSELCKAGNLCVANRCVLTCTSHDDCTAGSECTPATSDDGVPIQLCRATTHRPPVVDPISKEQPGGYGWVCALGNADCAAAFACPNGRECDPAACADCQQDATACAGDPECNIGVCGDGSPCTFTTCAANECTPFTCIGQKEGDASAYCTHQDCSADDDCPAGYYCGETRIANDICGNTCTAGGTCSHDPAITCTSDGQCQKGNNSRCGETTDPCIDIATANAAGQKYFEGGLCLMRKTCLLRRDCARCDTNLDCSRGGEDLVCTNHHEQNVCARMCNSSTNCRADEFCLPYAPASGTAPSTCELAPTLDCNTPADCTMGGGCLPRGVCVPAAGRCDASDSVSKYCRHCVSDEDCGGADKGGVWGCVDDVYTGEFACFDLAFSFECSTDAGCPISPGGRHGHCLENEVGEDSPLYHRCYYPYSPELERYTCN